MNGRILIVEDNREISKLISDFLQQNEYEVRAVYDGDNADKLLKNQDFDIVIMDLMLPGISGEQLIRDFRKYSDKPVIVISAKSMMETKLEMLRIGADDFILKPFDLNEVLVRIQVVLRRMGTVSKNDNVLSYKNIIYSLSDNTVKFNDKNISLTSKEMQLLKLFLSHPKKVFTKANLYESVWNDVYYYEDNTINVHMSNLRSKLKKVSGEEYIETVWGVGYRLKEQE
ncbi:MAG: response regulator transcription factor [Oscillospiraceae bacterium]|nr:response regulator transcription factor [Oscillospiraceae bacterium]